LDIGKLGTRRGKFICHRLEQKLNYLHGRLSVARTGAKKLSLAWLGLILAFSATGAFAQQSEKPAGSSDPVPQGASKARPAKHLMKAWANRSLWVKNPPVLGGCECFDFKNFDDCQIWSFDENMRMTRKGGRFCEVREFIADKEPGHVPGDYGLILGGIGDTYTVSFPKAVTETTRTFAMRDTSSGWSFEVFDGPCSARAK
jgi:hypothetical protein